MTTRNRQRIARALKPLLATLVMLCFSFSLSAQAQQGTNPWTPRAEAAFASFNTYRQIIPDQYLTYALDQDVLRAVLDDAPLRFSATAAEEATILQLPMPDGRLERFRVSYAPVLAPGLAARFPAIRSYAGIGIDDPTASVRLDFTPAGFHAMVLSARQGTVFIDPYAVADTEHYIIYYKKDFTGTDTDFACHTTEEISEKGESAERLTGAARSLLQGDCRLRTYRLALTCTGEYAQFHGGTVEDVLAAMNTSMTRVNGVFERDVNATMEIVDSNHLLIFLDPATDPYNDGNPGQMIGECHDQCVDIIGSANFDIGHIFSTQGGGLAGLGVICSPNRKGNGVTGINNPVGDPFDIDYVAHELGHQYGAGHTQNNNCQRSGFSAMEPGSASTIMGYAGICTPNVQTNSDAYFHAISIQQMSNYINNDQGNDCAAFTETGNNAPTVAEVPDYVVPISTPFQLTAVGEDADGDALTYCWEQMDNEIGEEMPPQPTNTQGPVFRSFDPVESPTRYFPRLSDLVNGTAFNWESLPAVSRDMSFRVTVRDNNLGSGCTIETDMELTFTDAAGPFVVQTPNDPVEWTIGAIENVSWDVANTDAAPVSCNEVDILLSLDGGFTYPIVLASQVPNTGSFDIQVPNQPTTIARVMVVCSSNVFFDISDEDFSIIEPTSPTFLLDVTPFQQEVCGDVETVTYEVDLTGFAGFDEMITLSTTGEPAAATVMFSENDVIPAATSTLTIGNLTAVENGAYEIILSANSASVSIDRTLGLQVTNGTIEALTLVSPASGESGLDLNVGLSWGAVPEATSYYIEIATSPNFEDQVIETATVADNFYEAQSLAPLTVYYWRVVADNICGRGTFSALNAFQTLGDNCLTYSSEDVPVNIPANSENTVTATINVPDDISIEAVTTSLEIAHSWVGDLDAVLQAPDGTEILLFSQPGIEDSQFGCEEDNLLLTFDDAAENDADVLANTCEAGDDYAISGVFQPIEPLNNFIGNATIGTWSLIVSDYFDQDGGNILSWTLDLCVAAPPIITPALVNNILIMESGDSRPVPNSHLVASVPGDSPASITYTLLSLPTEGELLIDGNAAAIGSTFTQAMIDAGILVYTNTDFDATQDAFRFSVTTTAGGWIPDETFQIQFGTPALVGAAYANEGITCAGETTGQITVNATGPNMPFTYSLDGMTFQMENVFVDLAAGSYEVTVMDDLGNTTVTNSVILEATTNIMVAGETFGSIVTAETSGGFGALSYSLDGVNFQSENIFFDVPNGTYELTVVDENGCVGTTTVTVEGIISVVVETTDPICANEENGTITITEVVGGVGPFLYSINGPLFMETNAFGNLPAGTYNVEVMDTFGSVFTVGEFVLAAAPEILLTVETDENNITATATGGTGAFMYSIDGEITFQTDGTFTDLPNGEYVIAAMDENGCTVESDIILIDLVGVNDLVFDLDFNLYPNPVSTELTLELRQATAREIGIQVYDVAGRLLIEQEVAKPGEYLKTTIDVNQLPSGSYEVVVSDGVVKGRGRFVKL